MTNFVLVKNLFKRPRLDGDIYVVETFEKDHDISLRVDKGHKNSIPFQKMSVSESWR